MRLLHIPLILSSLFLAPPADAACTACGRGLRCIQAEVAQACLELPLNCILTGYCPGSGRKPLDGLGQSVLGLTLLEPPGTVVPPPRALPRAGRSLVGREAARVVGARTSSASEPEVVFSTILHGGDESTLAFRSREGDGFSLRRDREGPQGARLVVRQLEHGRPGRVLASERVAAEDLLMVPVRFGGRTRLVTFQALRVPDPERDHRLQAMRTAMTDDASKADPEPPFEVEVMDE